MMLRLASFALLIVSLVLSACSPGDVPELQDEQWCYRYDLTGSSAPTNSAGNVMNILPGEWENDGLGLRTVNNELIVNWSEAFFIHPIGVLVTVYQPTITADNQVLLTGSVFGDNISLSQTIPTSFSESELVLWVENDSSELIDGNSVNITLQTSQPLQVRELEVRGEGPNPFPRNDCAPTTPTPSTPTETPTPSTPTPTPAPVDPDCPVGSTWSYTLTPPSSQYVTVTNGNASTWSTTMSCYPYKHCINVSHNPGVQFSRIIFKYHSNMTGITGRLFLGNMPLAPGVYQTGDVTLSYGNGNIAPGNYSISLNGDMYANSVGTVDSITVCGKTGNNPVGDPTPTATATFTPPPTATRTQIPVVTSTPSPTAVTLKTNTPRPLPTLTFTPRATPTPGPTFTPIPPTLTFTPPPTITPRPTNTAIALPTQPATGTPNATGTGIPGPGLTPIPGTPGVGSPVPWNTPGGTWVGTPTYGDATYLPTPDNLDDWHSDAKDGLGTAVAYMNDLPSDWNAAMPDVNNLGTFAGYAKYAVSGVNLQEIFGVTVYPIVQHSLYGFVVVVFVASARVIWRLVLVAFKFAAWVIRWIFKLIPFFG